MSEHDEMVKLIRLMRKVSGEAMQTISPRFAPLRRKGPYYDHVHSGHETGYTIGYEPERIVEPAKPEPPAECKCGIGTPPDPECENEWHA